MIYLSFSSSWEMICRTSSLLSKLITKILPLWLITPTLSRPTTETKWSSEIIKLGKKWESQSYYRNRASQYPPITDQLDDLFHQGVFSAEMTAKIQKVKDEFPKPE